MPLSFSLRNPIRVTPTRCLRVWLCRVSVFFSSPFFAFSSSADETCFTPCLKSRFFFFSAFEYRAGGTDEAFWLIIILITITTICHLLLLAPYHKPIMWVLPISNQKMLHQLSQIACTIPHFFPLSSPFFSLQPSCSAYSGVLISFHPFSQFPGTGFGGMECAAFEDMGSANGHGG